LLTSLLLGVLALAATSAAAPLPDADADGVDDDHDACPDSPRASRDHVDAHGCTQLQVDADLDGWCNPDRPRDEHNRWLDTKDAWCMGVDNCKFVYNPKQPLGDAASTLGLACMTGLYCTVLYCTVLYCTVLYCTVP
jgi:hypothetical protein